MGFASGVRAGTGLVESILAERRAKEEFGWKRDDRSREEGIRTREDALRDENIGLIRDGSAVAAQPQQGIVAPPPPTEPGAAAAPAVAKAQGDAGVRVGTAAGIPTNAPGSPQPDVPVTAGNAAAAVAGTATAPTPQVQATPAAGPQNGRQLGRDELIQRNLQQQALLRGKVGDYNTAKQNERTSGVQGMTDEAVKSFMAMPQEKREELAYSPNLTGDIPMVTTATDKNGMTVIAIDPKTGRPMDSGKPIKLSWADAAQLHAANQLAQAGFGAEALDMASKVNARIGEAVKANNDLMGNVATKNTDAAYKGGSLAEQGRHNRASEANQAAQVAVQRGRAEREKWTPSGPTQDDRGILLIDQNTGQTKVQALPEGVSAKALWPKITGIRGGGTGAGGGQDWKPVQPEGTTVVDKAGNRGVMGDRGEVVAHGAPTNALGREKFLTDIGIPKGATKNFIFEPSTPGSNAIPVSYVSPVTGERRVYNMADPNDKAELAEAYKLDTEVIPALKEGYAKMDRRMQNRQDSAEASRGAAENARSVLGNIKENERMRAQRLGQ